MFCFSRGAGYFKEAYRPKKELYQLEEAAEINV
jgi:hypothetical protein